MALVVKNAERIFILKRAKKGDDVKLDDPNKGMSTCEVQKFYSGKYPELTTSVVSGPNMRDGKAEYTFQTIIGEKG